MSTPGHRRLWIVLLLLQSSIFLFLVGDRREARDRETGAWLRLQHAARSGQETAEPRDRTSTFAQGGLLQQVLLAGGLAASPDSSRAASWCGLFFDELLLLLGTWLLARSLFADPRTAFVVAAAAVGSSLWVDHVWSNFRTFSALPLLLHLARSFRRSGAPAVLFAALNLAGLQALGKPPSHALLTPAAALLLFAAFRNVLDPALPAALPKESRGRLAAAAAAGLASWIPVVVLALAGTGDSAPADRSSFLRSIVGFSGLDAPGSLLDAGMGIAPVPGFTLYCGFLTLGFAAAGLRRLGLRAALRGTAAALAVVLALGLVAAVGDRLSPSIHSGRPALGAPLLRLLLVFLAGLGFEGFIRNVKSAPDRLWTRLAAGTALIGAALFATSLNLPTTMNLEGVATRWFAPGAPAGTVSPLFRDLIILRELFDMSAIWAFIAAGVFMLIGSGPRSAPLAIALVLFLIPLDVFGWKFRMTFVRTAAPVAAAPAKTSAPTPGRLVPGSAAGRLAGFALGLNALLWIAGSSVAALRMCAGPLPRAFDAGNLHASRAAG